VSRLVLRSVVIDVTSSAWSVLCRDVYGEAVYCRDMSREVGIMSGLVRRSRVIVGMSSAVSA